MRLDELFQQGSDIVLDPQLVAAIIETADTDFCEPVPVEEAMQQLGIE